MAGTKRPAEGPEKATTKKVLVQSGTDRDISKSRRARKPVFTSSSSEVIDAFQDSSVAEYSTVGKAGTDHGVKSKLVSSEDDRSERQNTNSNGTDAFLNGRRSSTCATRTSSVLTFLFKALPPVKPIPSRRHLLRSEKPQSPTLIRLRNRKNFGNAYDVNHMYRATSAKCW